MANFYTDFLTKSPYFHNTTRVADLNYLEPVLREAVQSIMADSLAAGQPLILFETYRSPERQQFLYQQGATQLQVVGTHGYGLAADLVKDLYGQPSWAGDFSFLGVLAKKYNLVWGGNWPTLRDMVHVQRIAVSDQPRLFNGTWYPPTEGYNPLAEAVKDA